MSHYRKQPITGIELMIIFLLFAFVVTSITIAAHWVAVGAGPAIDAEDQATRATEQPIAKELAKKMKGKYYE